MNWSLSFACNSKRCFSTAWLCPKLLGRKGPVQPHSYLPPQKQLPWFGAAASLDSLPPELSQLEKEVLVHYMEGKSYVEIGEAMGRHVKSIDNALQRIKRKLLKYLEEK